jgi:AcrR family transcriptional regulator
MKKISKRQIQKMNTRNRIIETAYRVFSEKGFSAATSVIAKEAGISHGSIFVHFPTLNDLLVCLLSDFGDKIGTSMHALTKNCDSIESLLDEHLNVLEEYEAFYTRLISEINLLPSEAKSTFVMIQSIVAFHFSSIVEREIEKGTVKKLPTHMLFNTWLGLVHYYLQNREFFSSPNESVLRRYKAEILSTYLNLITQKGEE